ncbi:MAG: hypothetical protein AB8B51_10180 [Sedimentitalea sp.]
MPQYNDSFKLDVDDIDLIESALRRKKKELSLKRLALLSDTSDSETEAMSTLDETLINIHDLLGRLHNQKVFYRPQKAAYIGG